MALRSTVGLVLGVSFLYANPILATDVVATDGVTVSGEAFVSDRRSLDSEGTEPRISGTLPARIESRLREAFPVALQRVSDLPECRELFSRLGTDALERITSTIYYPTTAQMESRACQRGVVAFTYVGSPQTRLCRGFASLGAERAAVTLIHEALHWAGLSERPLDENGLDPRDIDRMVRQACGL